MQDNKKKILQIIKCLFGIHKVNKWYAYTVKMKIGICSFCHSEILKEDETFKNVKSKLPDFVNMQKEMGSLKGKNIVITGVSGGIGGVLYGKLKERGANLLLLDRPGSLKGFHSIGQIADFRSIKDTFVASFMLQRESLFIDAVINLAGIGIYKDLKDLKISEFQESIQINLVAPFIVSRVMLPALLRTKHSLIINVGSGMGVIPTAGRSAYCASKFGLRGLSLSLNKELKGKVDVSLLTLGSVMTSFGTGGILARKWKQLKGKKYLNPGQVADKIISIIESDYRKREYVMYPKGYK